jgi:hypothetical protein
MIEGFGHIGLSLRNLQNEKLTELRADSDYFHNFQVRSKLSPGTRLRVWLVTKAQIDRVVSKES